MIRCVFTKEFIRVDNMFLSLKDVLATEQVFD